MKIILFLLFVFIFIGCSKKIVIERTTNFPKQREVVAGNNNKTNVWVFIMAGQSNMAGRGMVEPGDTLPQQRILTIDRNDQLIIAKEPLHFYEPTLTGLDCGLSFAKEMIKKTPDSISLLLIPIAVGGSSVSQWLGDSVHRNVKLYSNFLSKTELSKKYGVIKGILWHQGESDANENDIKHYKGRLSALFKKFRDAIGNNELPILLGELGTFSKYPEYFNLLNKEIHAYSIDDNNTAVITTGDLKHKGDSLHFNSKGQREMGRRFANIYIKEFIKR